MCTITSTEFKTNYGKYIELAKVEELVVTQRGKVIFSTVPAIKQKIEKLRSFYGVLPSDAKIDAGNRE